jgi:hypothetical protein
MTVILLSYLEILTQVLTRIVEKQLYGLAHNYPKSKNLLFSRTSSSVEVRYLGYLCEAGSEMTGK